jgi:class 3 adenylate cyclase/CheY-like chemotaxis protein
VHDPPRILAIDDTVENIEILRMRLSANGYEVLSAADGEEGLAAARDHLPDLILLDVMMPKMDGITVVRQLKQDPVLRAIPVILVTAKSEARDLVEGLDAGGDDYLTKPFDHSALMARVRSMLRQKELHDQVDEQARQLAEWNRTLEARVAEQVEQLERARRLQRFLPPQIADLVTADKGEELLASHRRDVAIVFCDLRGFTAVAETAEPEEVMEILSEYHEELGAIIHHHEGTLERFLGDGMMVLFNDPVPCPDPAHRAVRMAVDMRIRMTDLEERWRRRGRTLGFGVGIAQGFATMGRIGFDGRWDYAAIGTVANLASRLCGEAADGQILISQKVASAVEPIADLQGLGEMTLKGISRPTPVYDVVALRQG